MAALQRERRALRAQWAMAAGTGLPGIAAVIALLFTFTSLEQSQDTLNVTEQGQITDRYNDAVTNLGADSVDIRLGGIYALQRIMTDSPRDQPAIVRILSAYVRVHAPAPAEGTKQQAHRAVDAVDTTAALSVLKQRDPAHDGQARPDLRKTDLRTWVGSDEGITDPEGKTDPNALRLTDFSEANLGEANLYMANLNQARFTKTDLRQADLRDAILVSARFREADMSGVDLRTAWFSKSDLRGAKLNGANLKNLVLLSESDFGGADLADAELGNLKLAKNLTVEQVVRARFTPSTELPVELTADPRVQKRMKEAREDS